MKILVVGGGSGGHITPAVAVVREILERSPRTNVEFWTDKKYYKNVVKITTELGVRWGSSARADNYKVPYIRVRKICAGKFRRYSGWTWLDWLKHLDIVFRDLIFGNIIGAFQFVGGLIQSFFRLLPRSKRPDVIFLKGGFVSLPVGIVARKFKIPYVIHESDAVPGLANRILMKNASAVAMGWQARDGKDTNAKKAQNPVQGQPACDYSIAQVSEKVNREGDTEVPKVFTGIPVAAEFRKISPAQQGALKKSFGFDPERPLVVITGGSQGAENINEAIRAILPELLEFTSVGLVAGHKHYENMVELKRYEDWNKAKLQSNFRLWEFNSAMHELLGAADVVVSRAGATTIAELAALEKAVILVPFEALPNSHQLCNAKGLASAGAVAMIKDGEMRKKPSLLLDEIRHLVRSPRERATLAEKLHYEATPDAAARLAIILLQLVGNDDGQQGKSGGQRSKQQERRHSQRSTRREKRLRKVEKHKSRAQEIK